MNIKRSNKVIMALLLAASALFTIELMAQDLKKSTLEGLLSGGETYRIIEDLPNLRWWGDVCIKLGIDLLFAVNPKTGKETLLTTREKVNQVLNSLITPTATIIAVSGQKRSKVQHFHNTELPQPDKPYMLIKLPAGYIVYDFEGDEFVQSMPQVRKRKGSNIDYAPEGGHIAYTVRNNLFVDNKAVTREPEGIVCGQSVHRNGFDINKGTFWSPQGDLLAFYRMNESMVIPYPLVDITPRVALVDKIRYPMAGMLSHQAPVGIYNPDTQETVHLNTGGSTNRYFTNISWAPDGKSLYLIEPNREQNHARLCRHDSKTGELMSTPMEETHTRYVEPQHPILFLPWDHTLFIYQSQRDGYNHLYFYNTDGKLIKQLTRGGWLVQKILGFNAKKREVIIISMEVSPLQSNLYKVSVNTGRCTPLDNGKGIHEGILSASGSYIIDRYSTPDVPRQIDIITTQNGKNVSLLTARNPCEGFIMSMIEIGTIETADGRTDPHYCLVKPADFSLGKKYPTIIYVYSGPHDQLVTNDWMAGIRGWDIYMTNKGYIMFILDNHGSEDRGLEFENVTFRRLGIEEEKDQIKGVEFLRSLLYADGERIDAHGWSFGGHMTAALMPRYPEIFKVGVVGGPVIDWSYYEIMYGERYMGTLQSNPQGYKETNLKNLAGNLKGHLLIVHDDHGSTYVSQHTLSFMKACTDVRTYPDLFIYPGHPHNVKGCDRIHLHEKITRYSEDYLQSSSIFSTVNN